jgi:Glycosyl hydrolases family 15
VSASEPKQSEIQMGNGTLLATFSQTGEIDQVYAPSIDALQARLGTFRTSVIFPSKEAHREPELVPLTSEHFQIRVQLMPGSQTLIAEYHHLHRPLRLLRKLGLHPTEPIILDSWRVMDEDVGLFHESIPWMGGSTFAHCSLYHPVFNALVHHRGRRWLGVVVRGDTQWVRVGHVSEEARYKMWSGEKIFAPISAQDLTGFPAGTARSGWDQVVQGPATYGVLATRPQKEIEFSIICAESENHLSKLIDVVAPLTAKRFFEISEGWAEKRMEPAKPWLDRIRNSHVRAMCERSIDVLHALQDARSGALMAAAEVDPFSKLSGGYGFSWPRDGAYLASALGAFGFHSRVEHYLKFLTETQDVSGAWWQRYLASGHAGPSWGRIQIDEPASAILAAFQHYVRTKDLLWLEKYWPTIESGLYFLKTFHSEKDHPMGLPSHDLWEERMGVHCYSLSVVAQAFLAGAFLARERIDRDAQREYHRESRRLTRILKERFVLPDGNIHRSFIVNSFDYARGGGNWDGLVDTSLLGLVSPLRMLRPEDPHVKRLVKLIHEKLWARPIGGVYRYEFDAYRGGNPWILTTLWLGQVELSLGNIAEARECFQWATSKATSLGMLAEQVSRETGKPFWVMPLGWSHAMYLLFVRDVLDRGLEGQIWENGL